MEKPRVVCPENEGLAIYMLEKRQELAQGPKGLSENMEMTLNRAYSNVCSSKTIIWTPKDFSHIKGVGKWILKLIKDYFEMDSGGSENKDLTNGRKNVRTKSYLPQKNSVSYALLITLYRRTMSGNDFMHKQELIDAAEASGLSRVPIAPEKGKGKRGHLGSSPREWYSGWTCMKTLITKGLVVKSSCPAKYMLTEEGKVAARECHMRSGLSDFDENLINKERISNVKQNTILEMELSCKDSVQDICSLGMERHSSPIDVPFECHDVVSKSSRSKETSYVRSAVPCHIFDDQVHGSPSDTRCTLEKDFCALSAADKCQLEVIINKKAEISTTCDHSRNIHKSSVLSDSLQRSLPLSACPSKEFTAKKQGINVFDAKFNVLRMPPLRFGELFEDVYAVILILDDREQFATRGSRSRKILENICAEFKIQIEVRRLPVGDGIWIARHKQYRSEYVLDFIVERKKIDDLRCSIRDNRYRDQKLRLLRCGLKKMIYMVEGDPNCSEAAESIKTACFTTEILEGFDVQRTSGLGETLRKYGFLSQSINWYYSSLDPDYEQKRFGDCPLFQDFVRSCQDLEKMTISDVFAIQLMQVPHVTEEVAIAVLDIYPTLYSLASAYALLEGDTSAQEELLKKKTNDLIGGAASRNIFHFIWGGG